MEIKVPEEEWGVKQSCLESKCMFSKSSTGFGPLFFFIFIKCCHTRKCSRTDEDLNWDGNFIFLLHLEPAYTGKSTSAWFNDYDISGPEWPWKWPDLNFIQNLWSFIKRKMIDTRCWNVDKLKTTIKANWSSIIPEQCHMLITSMPHHPDAVIQAKGLNRFTGVLGKQKV